jgi:predicted nucleic acid-binding protein
VATVYVDTSALARVLLGEPDAEPIRSALRGYEEHVSSRLLGVELHRIGIREGRTADADKLLLAVTLIPIDEPVLTEAETLGPATVATLDAIHLATALSLHRDGVLDALLTYDARLAHGAREHGIEVRAPS